MADIVPGEVAQEIFACYEPKNKPRRMSCLLVFSHCSFTVVYENTDVVLIEIDLFH